MRAEFLISLSAIKTECEDQELTKCVTCLFLSGMFGGSGGREAEKVVFIFYLLLTLS